MVRDHDEFERLVKVENKEREKDAREMGVEPREVEIVEGGRAALLEQQEQERTLTEQGMEAPGREAEQVQAPASQPQRQQPAQQQKRETLRERMEREAKAAGITSRVIIENSNGREMGRRRTRTPWDEDD